MTPLRFAGIDPSLTGTGVCVIDANGAYVYSHRISPPNKLNQKGNRGKRLRFIYDELMVQLEGVALAGIEQGAYGATSKHHLLGKALGVCELALQVQRIPYFYTEVSRVRKFVVGKGNLKKEHVAEYMRRFAPEAPDVSLDESDAYILARMARIAYLWGAGDALPLLSTYQRDTLSRLIVESV